jgi:hypothetical protein
MGGMGPVLCPHKQNPLSCLTCFQEKARRPKPRPEDVQRTQMTPPMAKGKVVSQAELAQNPAVAMQLARKQQALEKIAGRPLPVQQPAPVRAPDPAVASSGFVPTTQAINPHAAGRPRPQVETRVATSEEEGGYEGSEGPFSDEQLAELASEFPAHRSVIDNLPSHPDASGPRVGGGALRPVVRGRPTTS